MKKSEKKVAKSLTFITLRDTCPARRCVAIQRCRPTERMLHILAYSTPHSCRMLACWMDWIRRMMLHDTSGEYQVGMDYRLISVPVAVSY